MSRSDPEISKLCFEYFKHFTTIATAAALLELVLYRQLDLNTASAVLGVGLLGLTLLLCLLSLVPLSIGTARNGELLRIGRLFRFGMMSTAGTYFLGLVIFALAALSPHLKQIPHPAFRYPLRGCKANSTVPQIAVGGFLYLSTLSCEK